MLDNGNLKIRCSYPGQPVGISHKPEFGEISRFEIDNPQITALIKGITPYLGSVNYKKIRFLEKSINSRILTIVGEKDSKEGRIVRVYPKLYSFNLEGTSRYPLIEEVDGEVDDVFKDSLLRNLTVLENVHWYFIKTLTPNSSYLGNGMTRESIFSQ